MTDVWVARDSNGTITCISHEQDVVACYGVADEFAAITRETLLTLEQAAVIEAAKAWATDQRGWLKPLDEALAEAVDALREMEGEA